MVNVESKQSVVVGVDAGNVISGVVVLLNGKIHHAENADNAKVFDYIKSLKETEGFKVRVIIEDIMPYLSKLSPQTIETCKWMGELRYRLKTARISHGFVPRASVKKWVFDTYPEIVIPMVNKKIAKKDRRTKSGDLWAPSMIYVDDAIVTAAMRYEWHIPAKVFKANRFKISKHAWQALAMATLYWTTATQNKKTPR